MTWFKVTVTNPRTGFARTRYCRRSHWSEAARGAVASVEDVTPIGDLPAPYGQRGGWEVAVHEVPPPDATSGRGTA